MGELTPVLKAERMDHLKDIELFIDNNSHPDDKFGVLVAAVVANQNDVVAHLLQSHKFLSGSDLNCIRHQRVGYSLLTMATIWQTQSLMHILLETGGLHPNTVDNLGISPIHGVTELKYVPLALEKLVLLMRSGAHTGILLTSAQFEGINNFCHDK